MATIFVDRIIGEVKNGSQPYIEDRQQEFDRFNTNFDQSSSRMFFKQGAEFKIAMPDKSRFLFFSWPNLNRAKVIDDPTKGSEKELAHHEAFLSYFKPYCGPAETAGNKPVFLILGERWIKVSKDKYLPDTNHFFFVEYDLEGASERIKKKLEPIGDKVLFTREIFQVDGNPVSPEKTNKFHLYSRFIEEGTGSKINRLMNAAPKNPIKDSDYFTIRAPEPEKLREELERLLGPILNMLEQKRLLEDNIRTNVPADAQAAMLEQVEALTKSFKVSEEELKEELNEYFSEAYGGKPDEDDLEAYLSDNFPELRELLTDE